MYIPLLYIPLLFTPWGRDEEGTSSLSRRDNTTDGGGNGNTGQAPYIGGAYNGSTLLDELVAYAYGFGSNETETTPAGEKFAGRLRGGGTHDNIFGNRTYGSGYLSGTSRGVSGRDFPYYFWPVVWGTTTTEPEYLHPTEYGHANETLRPGGVLVTLPFQSPSQNTTLRIVADYETTRWLLWTINGTCHRKFDAKTISAQNITMFDPDSNEPGNPKPEEVIQYYRASSIALTLDGFNDTFALNQSSTETPLPGWIDQNLLQCVNATIGRSALLYSRGISKEEASKWRSRFIDTL